MSINCDICEKSFMPWHSGSKYCSEHCSQEARRKETVRKIEVGEKVGMQQLRA